MDNIINLNNFRNEKNIKYNIDLIYPEYLKTALNEITFTELEELKLKLLDSVNNNNKSGIKFLKHMIREFNTIQKRVNNDELLSFENLNSILGVCSLRIEQMSLYISFLDEKDLKTEKILLEKIKEIFKLTEDKLLGIKEEWN